MSKSYRQKTRNKQDISNSNSIGITGGKTIHIIFLYVKRWSGINLEFVNQIIMLSMYCQTILSLTSIHLTTLLSWPMTQSAGRILRFGKSSSHTLIVPLSNKTLTKYVINCMKNSKLFIIGLGIMPLLDGIRLEQPISSL